MFSKSARELIEFKTYQIIPKSSAPKNCSRLVKETFELLEVVVCLIKEKFALFDDSSTEYVQAQFTDSTYKKIRIILANACFDHRVSEVDKQNTAPIDFLKQYDAKITKECHTHRIGWSNTVITLNPSHLLAIKEGLEQIKRPDEGLIGLDSPLLNYGF